MDTRIVNILKADGKLIKLKTKGLAVFIGDTHGDINATETVLSRYMKEPYTLIFLGDYVDRGENSKENIELLLNTKRKFPEKIFLLAGNHEGYPLIPFSPANFWESLNPKEKKDFSEIFSCLPLAVTTNNGIVALHGVIPDVASLDEINHIIPGDKKWKQITWGDLYETEGEYLGDIWGRPSFGSHYFYNTMRRIGTTVLIRAHQRDINTISFNGRCVTLLTSHSYGPTRKIALVDLEKPKIDNGDQIKIIEI